MESRALAWLSIGYEHISSRIKQVMLDLRIVFYAGRKNIEGFFERNIEPCVVVGREKSQLATEVQRNQNEKWQLFTFFGTPTFTKAKAYIRRENPISYLASLAFFLLCLLRLSTVLRSSNQVCSFWNVCNQKTYQESETISGKICPREIPCDLFAGWQTDWKNQSS